MIYKFPNFDEKIVDVLKKMGPAKWRVTVYDVMFGELRFLDNHTT